MFFIFSSRRRHTRYWRDWSSDVCSSDLSVAAAVVSSTASVAADVLFSTASVAADVVSSTASVAADAVSSTASVAADGDRESGVEGKGVDIGGSRVLKKKI